MKRTILISGLAMPILMQPGAHAQKKPNIILIVTDQQRGDALGCAGKYAIRTPNIDSLASDGFSSTTHIRPPRAALPHARVCLQE